MRKEQRRTVELVVILIGVFLFFFAPTQTMQTISLCAAGALVIAVTIRYMMTNQLSKREFFSELIEAAILLVGLGIVIYTSFFYWDF